MPRAENASSSATSSPARTRVAHKHAATVRGIDAQYRFGPLFYLVLLLIALWSPLASLALGFAIAIFFLLPPRS